MSEIQNHGNQRPTQRLTQQTPSSLQGADNTYKFTRFSESLPSRKENFFTKLASKVSAFVRSIFSAAAAPERKKARPLTTNHSKIDAEHKAGLKVVIAEEKVELRKTIKDLKKEITGLKNQLSHLRSNYALSMSSDDYDIKTTESELEEKRTKLEVANAQLKKLK